MEVGVHIVFASRSEPGEIGHRGTELAGTDRLGPAEHLILVALPDDADLVVAEAEAAVDAHAGTAEQVAADDADAFRFGADEILQFAHFHARNGRDVGGADGGGTGDGHFAAQVETTGGEEFADGGEHHRGDGPHDNALADGAQMMDLHTHIAGGMLAFEPELLDILQLLQRRVAAFAVGDDHALGGEFRHGVDTRLDVFDLILAGEIHICGEGCRGESRDEDGVGRIGGAGDDAVGPLYERRPKTALQERFLDLFRGQGADIFLSEIDAGILAVGLDEHFQQFALLSSDDGFDRTADGRGEKNVGTFLVGQHGGAA